jgi:hypothetical protein
LSAPALIPAARKGRRSRLNDLVRQGTDLVHRILRDISRRDCPTIGYYRRNPGAPWRQATEFLGMRLKLIFVLPFAIGIASWQTCELIHRLGARGDPITDGEVTSREEFRSFGGIPAGRLSIRVVGTDTVVIAETNAQAMQELPDRVRFHYTGEAPGQRVAAAVALCGQAR